MPFGVVGKVLMEWKGLNGIYSVRFGFKMWEILISAAENSNKFQKTRFGRKNWLRT